VTKQHQLEEISMSLEQPKFYTKKKLTGLMHLSVSPHQSSSPNHYYFILIYVKILMLSDLLKTCGISGHHIKSSKKVHAHQLYVHRQTSCFPLKNLHVTSVREINT
jgi:hypothetical protein